MSFEELIKKFEKIPCQEHRQSEKDYCEVVVAQTAMPVVTELLQTYFGLPVKPEGQKPSREAENYAAPYGGVYANQTLYASAPPAGKNRELALLWPWGSGRAVTVKLARQ